MSKKIEKLKLSDIKANVKTQVRVELNPEALETYTQHAKDTKAAGADAEFPPLVVFRDEKGANHLGDGFTRRAALKAAGVEEYDCEIRTGSAFDAFKFGARINQTHGARLTTKDKRNILSIALDDKDTCLLSNNAIAKEYGFSEFFVRTHRPKNKTPEAVTAVSRSGKKTKVKTSKIGKKGGKTSTSKSGGKTPAAGAVDENSGIDGALGGTVGGAPDSKKDEETERSLTRVCKVVTEKGIYDGEKLKKSIEDGSLPLSPRAIRDWAGTSDARVALIALLVIDNRWQPKQAFAFIDKEVTFATKIEHLHNLQIAGGKHYTVGGGKLPGERVTDGTNLMALTYDPSKVEVTITPK